MTAVYHFYIRKNTDVYHFYLRRNTDLKDSLRARSGQGVDRETAVYHFYIRKTTDLKDRLRTRSGQRDSSLPFLHQKEYRLKRQTKDTEWTERQQSTISTSEGIQTAVYHFYLRRNTDLEDKGQGVDRETAVYHFYIRKNTDLKDRLRTKSGQRDSSLPFLHQKEYRL